MPDEEVIMPEKPELIGQKIKWMCGIYRDTKNPERKPIKMFAKGNIVECKFDAMNNFYRIKVHFPEHKKWKQFDVPEFKELLLHEIQLESGYRFRR